MKAKRGSAGRRLAEEAGEVRTMTTIRAASFGINCGGNVPQLACLVYTDTSAFDFRMHADYIDGLISDLLVWSLFCSQVLQGCAFQGLDYGLASQLASTPEGVVWNRDVIEESTGLRTPLFHATWATGTLEGRPVAIETFPLRGGLLGNASVYLRPEAQNNMIIWTSQRVSTAIGSANAYGNVTFTTAQTGPTSVTTTGTLRIGRLVLGLLMIQGTIR